MSGREELLEQISIMNELASANICRMDDGMLRFMAQGLRAMMSKQYLRGLSREDVARHFRISTRTLERWQQKYEDFPRPRHFGMKEVSYDPAEVIRWGRAHIEDIRGLRS